MNRSSSSATIFIVDDDAALLRLIEKMLRREGLNTRSASCGKEALAWLGSNSADLLLLDLKLPDMSGRELLEQLVTAGRAVPFAVITGQGDERVAVEMMKWGAMDYLVKDKSILEFLPSVVKRCLERLDRERRLAAAEESIRISEERFALAVRGTADGIFDWRLAKNEAYLSPRLKELIGFADHELEDRMDAILSRIHPQDVERVTRAKQAHFRDCEPFHVDVRLQTKAGEYRWYQWRGQAVWDDQGRPARMAGAISDITELQQAHDRLVQSERLAAIGQMMAGLAHESRNALQRSQACLEMLAMDVQDRPDLLELVTEIQKSQDYLHHIYEEVRGYAAPIKLRYEPCHLGELLDEVWRELSGVWKGRSARLQQHGNAGDMCGEVDRYSIGQVFRNVLENSLAACPDPLEIDTRWSQAEIAGQPLLTISIRDNGPGLTTEARRRIFEPFFTTKTRGTGLGMAITKRIVETHGGQIEVGAGNGGGAEILIHLPRGRAAEYPSVEAVAEQPSADRSARNVPEGRPT